MTRTNTGFFLLLLPAWLLVGCGLNQPRPEEGDLEPKYAELRIRITPHIVEADHTITTNASGQVTAVDIINFHAIETVTVSATCEPLGDNVTIPPNCAQSQLPWGTDNPNAIQFADASAPSTTLVLNEQALESVMLQRYNARYGTPDASFRIFPTNRREGYAVTGDKFVRVNLLNLVDAPWLSTWDTARPDGPEVHFDRSILYLTDGSSLPVACGNKGNAPLTLTGANISGVDASNFSIAGPAFPIQVLPGESVVFNVSFDLAGGFGSRSATIHFHSPTFLSRAIGARGNP